MSTNCTIAVKQENGYEAIYVHWDGYTSGVGKTLMENFNTRESVEELIALGDCSKVSETTNITEVVAYHRDRSEPWSDVQTKFYSKLEDFIETQYYVYVFQDGEWHVSTDMNKNLIPIRNAIMKSGELDKEIETLWDEWNFGKGKPETKNLLDGLCAERDARKEYNYDFD